MFDTFATHAGLVYDVTDTDSWTQNGSAHGRIFATFEQKQLATGREMDRKRVNYLFIYSILTDRARDDSTDRFVSHEVTGCSTPKRDHP